MFSSENNLRLFRIWLIAEKTPLVLVQIIAIDSGYSNRDLSNRK